MPLRGGGVGRLMANAILNFHFEYPHTSLNNFHFHWGRYWRRKYFCFNGYGSDQKVWEQQAPLDWQRQRVQITLHILVFAFFYLGLVKVCPKCTVAVWDNVIYARLLLSEPRSLWASILRYRKFWKFCSKWCCRRRKDPVGSLSGTVLQPKGNVCAQ